ncbi:MAG: multicopper oxidase family protein [Burkholderiales bacterium]|nr:multicopper oxidase family protein [Burkholderiales bacterium]
MVTRRTILQWGAATGAGLLVPLAYRQGRVLASGLSPYTKSGLFFGYQPFSQPLFIPEVLTPLTGRSRLDPVPGAYPRPSGISGRPRTPTGNFDEVSHGIAPEFGHGPQEWNRFKSGFSPGDTHEQEYELVTEETTHRFVPGGPDVPVFTYRDASKAPGSGSTPGPTIVAEYLAPVVLRNKNALTAGRSGVNSTHHDVETSIHLHGAHAPSHSDGFPDFYVLAGEARDYFYPNIAPKLTDPDTLVAPVRGGEFDSTWIPSTLWYHDHAMDITGFNVTRGLAGFYLVFDDRERELAARGVTPEIGGRDRFDQALDVGLAIQDQLFNPDGTLLYDFLDHNGRLGNVFTVNGVVQPKHRVERRKYRFRILNASNARSYELRLSTRQKMCIIGTDSWLLPRAIEVESFQVGHGQRHDVIIDFRDAPDEVYLENILVQTDGRGAKEVDPSQERDMLLRFEVSGANSSETRCVDGTVIRGFKGIDPDGQFSFIRKEEIVGTRDFEFNRSLGAWTINNRFYNPRRSDATPVLGRGAERWILENNSGGWWHPIHTHLEGFQIKSVNGQAPRRERRFNSDLVMLEGGFVAEVYAKFRTFTGPFVFHCHAIEHEDMRMMGVIDPTPGPGGSTDAIFTHAPMDGETALDPNLSGVVPDCADLEREQRILFNKVGDTERAADRGVGIPDCKFDMSERGNQGSNP